jgi:hypothetical protein
MYAEIVLALLRVPLLPYNEKLLCFLATLVTDYVSGLSC